MSNALLNSSVFPGKYSLLLSCLNFSSNIPCATYHPENSTFVKVLRFGLFVQKTQQHTNKTPGCRCCTLQGTAAAPPHMLCVVHQGKFRLNIRKKFFPERVVGHWNSLPRDVVTAPGLSGFKEHLGSALSPTV